MIRFNHIMFLFMLLFWVVVAGFTVPSLVLGVVLAAAISWYNRDLTDSLIQDKWYFSGKKVMMLLLYTASLLWQIVLANIDLARIVLNPRLPIQPGVVRFNPGLKTDLSKTLLANSITLTPGTLAIDIEEDEFTVHFLTLASAQNVVEWPLIHWLRKMEEA